MGARARAGVVRGNVLSLRNRALRVFLLLVLAVIWAIAAWLLWDTVVPGNLSLHDVQLTDVPQATIHRAQRYESFFRIEFVFSQLVLIGVLVLYAKHGARFTKESAAGRIGTGMLLGMIGLAFVWLSQVPFRLAEVWWDRRYDQTESGYIETLFANWLQLGAEFLFICFALLVVMAIAGAFPRRWWLLAAPFFVALAALFGFIYPYLTPTDPVRRADLIAAERQDAAKQGIDPVALRVQDVTNFTSAPNAYAVGFGPSRQIVFWNTLLDGSFTDNEVKIVLAHETGHHSSGHLIEGIEWYALFALPGAWLIAVATRRRGGMVNPAAVPLSLLVIVVLDLASLPVYNLISRHMEQEADWKALETTHDPGSAEALFKQFTIQSLSDPNPPAWAYLFFESHPPVERRIEMVEAWRRRAR